MEVTSVLITICICIIVVLIWCMLFDTKRFVVKRYAFTDCKLRRNVKLVFLTDLHLKQYGKDNKLLLDAIRKENPDIILVGGDMIVATPKAKQDKAVHFLRQVEKIAPTVHAYGNHEHRYRLYPDVYGNSYEEYMSNFEQSSILFLDNASYTLDFVGIRISGLSMDREYYKRFKKPVMDGKYVGEQLGNKPDGYYQILLAHDPFYMYAYADWKPDLILSGHVHGGVAKLPFLGGVISPSLRLFPHYDGGLFEEFGTKMILGRGLGEHTIPVRLFNPGELVVVDLQKEE